MTLRWNLRQGNCEVAEQDCEPCYDGMETDTNGKWVSYEDYVALKADVRDVLEKVEWSANAVGELTDNIYSKCPICGTEKFTRHAENCALEALKKKVEEK